MQWKYVHICMIFKLNRFRVVKGSFGTFPCCFEFAFCLVQNSLLPLYFPCSWLSKGGAYGKFPYLYVAVCHSHGGRTLGNSAMIGAKLLALGRICKTHGCFTSRVLAPTVWEWSQVRCVVLRTLDLKYVAPRFEQFATG